MGMQRRLISGIGYNWEESTSDGPWMVSLGMKATTVIAIVKWRRLWPGNGACILERADPCNTTYMLLHALHLFCCLEVLKHI